MTARRLTRLVLVVVVAALVAVVARPPAEEERATGAVAAATMEHLDGSELARITLTPRAAERIDLQTAEITTGANGILTVPRGALILDPDGTTWVYTSPEPLVFVRARVLVDREESVDALLTEGPAAGTSVVTVGAAELYGVEMGIEH